MSKLTYERLMEMVVYDPEIGVFRWRKSNSSKCPVGSIIRGWNAGKGYKMVTIDYSRYYLHRLAWFYVHGRWPKNNIDHINRDQTDNRISNLREATHSQNGGNLLHKRNASGYKGVHLEKRTGRWFANICVNYRLIHLGTFNTPQEAHAAYEAAARKYFGEFARAA